MTTSVAIWLCLLIPAVAVAVTAVFFGKKMVWWEYGLLFGVPLVAILISYFVALSVRQVDTEYWNGYVTGATYYQSWQEWDHQICYRSCNCHMVYSGSGQNRTSHQECDRCPYDCSHCDNHAERWEATDNLGHTWNITSATFETWAGMWSNRVFVELNRHINYHTGVFGGDCGRDGDAYRAAYNGDSSKMIPVTLEKHYTNKVQTTFAPVDSSKVKEYELFSYPVYDRFNYDPVLGLKDSRASKLLGSWNARLGSSKQVHMLLLVFHNQALEAADYQEWYWKGGNKNEFILAISVGDSVGLLEGAGKQIIQWAKVISWTDQRGLKAQVENVVSSMRFEKGIDYCAVVDTMAMKVKSQFIRKNWHAFDNIKVQPSGTAVVVTLILTLLATLGFGSFAVFNEFENPSAEDRFKGFRKWVRRRRMRSW